MITGRGLTLLGASVIALSMGAALNHLVLAVLGTAGLAWMLAAVRSVSTAGVTVTRTASTAFLQEDTPIEAGFALSTTSGHQRVEARQPLPQGLVVTEGQERVKGVLEPDASLEAAFTITVPVPGLFHLPPVQVRTSDPFRLIEEDLDVEASPLSFTVTPRREAPREPQGRPRYTTPRPGEYISSNAGTGSEFYSIREYQPSDPLRLVNWKATAQKRDLMVNEYHDERVTQTVAIIDHRERTGFGAFVDAPIHEVARGAALTYEGSFQGGDSFTGLLLGDAPHLLQGDAGRAFTNRVMTALAEMEPSGACPIQLAVRESLHAIQQGAKVVVLSPLLYEDDKEGIMTLLARECSVTVIVPSLPEPINEEQREWARVHEENVKTLRGMNVHVVETPLGVLQHAMGEGIRV